MKIPRENKQAKSNHCNLTTELTLLNILITNIITINQSKYLNMYSGPPSPLWQEKRLVFTSFPKAKGNYIFNSQRRGKIPIKIIPLEKSKKPQL